MDQWKYKLSEIPTIRREFKIELPLLRLACASLDKYLSNTLRNVSPFGQNVYGIRQVKG